MVNYPTKKTSSNPNASLLTNSKRGMNLEDDLNQTNLSYLERGLANIHKKPTPITVVKVDYPSRSKARITEAYYKLASTTDYNGVYRGKAIDFEAKETHSNTSFALANLHGHQIAHMADIVKHGGIAFIILRFSKRDETYLLYIEDLLEFISLNQRQSLPYTWIIEKAHRIPYQLLWPIHYLKVLDETRFKGV